MASSILRWIGERRKNHGSAGALAGGAIVNLLFAAVGGYVREVSWTDELLGLLWLGMERYLAAL